MIAKFAFCGYTEEGIVPERSAAGRLSMHSDLIAPVLLKSGESSERAETEPGG